MTVFFCSSPFVDEDGNETDGVWLCDDSPGGFSSDWAWDKNDLTKEEAEAIATWANKNLDPDTFFEDDPQWTRLDAQCAMAIQGRKSDG